MMQGNGQLSVPPGFRFHPTDEELLYYYLRKKVFYEAIDLDVIREVDLNKLEPWDLKEKCKIGSGPQNEWYFFSHKDKKYPTGTRTNRATAAGFWKATGRDKAIHLSSSNNNSSKRIGMRKTLVFYTGRAPHGQKTDWIMHEYRLHDDNTIINNIDVQEDGWVVCRVFKKKIHNRSLEPQDEEHHFLHVNNNDHMMSTTMMMMNSNNSNNDTSSGGLGGMAHEPKHNLQPLYDCCPFGGGSAMHLPQLLCNDHHNHQSTDNNNNQSTVPHVYQSPYGALINNMDMVECSQNLLRLTSSSSPLQQQQHERFATDWSFLDKLLASHQQNQLDQPKSSSQAIHLPLAQPQPQRLPLQYLGFETDILKFSK